METKGERWFKGFMVGVFFTIFVQVAVYGLNYLYWANVFIQNHAK